MYIIVKFINLVRLIDILQKEKLKKIYIIYDFRGNQSIVFLNLIVYLYYKQLNSNENYCILIVYVFIYSMI